MHSLLRPLAMALGLVFAASALGACAENPFKPYNPPMYDPVTNSPDGMRPGGGLFTGKDGAFTIYRN